jgi:acyl-CoA reductase-like NAD-dependent aldehyde dehydrogenase
LKNPYTGAVITEQALETFKSANFKVINALAAQQAWAKIPLEMRQKLFCKRLTPSNPT